MSSQGRRIVVVANRLPVSLDEESSSWETSPGGLVAALTPIRERYIRRGTSGMSCARGRVGPGPLN